PKTKWIWSFQLTLDGRAVLTKLHRGKSLYLSASTARLFDPLVRQAIDAATGDDARLLDHLARNGPSMAEDVEVELGWDRKRVKSARNRLERVGAVVSDGLVFNEAGDWHFAPMRRWDAGLRTRFAGSREVAPPPPPPPRWRATPASRRFGGPATPEHRCAPPPPNGAGIQPLPGPTRPQRDG